MHMKEPFAAHFCRQSLQTFKIRKLILNFVRLKTSGCQKCKAFLSTLRNLRFLMNAWVFQAKPVNLQSSYGTFEVSHLRCSSPYKMRKEKDTREQVKLNYAHEIQQIFRYQYKDGWVDQSFINQHDRVWIQTFNKLVKEGFIEKKKSINGYRYKWNATFP